MDEVGLLNQDWRKLKTWPGLDIVILPKQDSKGKNSIKPPVVSDGFVQKLKRGLRLASKDDFLIKVFEMKNTYRQATEPLMAYKYLITHYGYCNFPLSWAKTVTADTEGRCPIGQDTIWIECSEDVTEVKALEILKEYLSKEPSTVTVCGGRHDNKDVISFCEKQGWTFQDVTQFYGSECEVKSIIIY